MRKHDSFSSCLNLKYSRKRICDVTKHDIKIIRLEDCISDTKL